MGHRDCRCLAPEEQKPTNQTNKTPKYEVFNKILNPHSSSLLKKKKKSQRFASKKRKMHVFVSFFAVSLLQKNQKI